MNEQDDAYGPQAPEEPNPFPPGTINHNRWADGIREILPEKTNPNELNPHQPGTTNYELWEAGVKVPTDAEKAIDVETRNIAKLFESKIRHLHAMNEFLGPNPLEGEDSEMFVKRLVRYSAAQALVIDAQNSILVELRIL